MAAQQASGRPPLSPRTTRTTLTENNDSHDHKTTISPRSMAQLYLPPLTRRPPSTDSRCLGGGPAIYHTPRRVSFAPHQPLGCSHGGACSYHDSDEVARNFRAAARGSKFASRGFRRHYQAAFAKAKQDLKVLEVEALEVHPRCLFGAAGHQDLAVRVAQTRRTVAAYRLYKTFERVLRNDAACCIQTQWRGYVVRRRGITWCAAQMQQREQHTTNQLAEQTRRQGNPICFPLEIGTTDRDWEETFGGAAVETAVPASLDALRQEEARLAQEIRQHKHRGPAEHVSGMRLRRWAIQRQIETMVQHNTGGRANKDGGSCVIL